MGAKKSASKDRGYVTASEWQRDGGGKKTGSSSNSNRIQKLPFHCCALSFLPFDHPVVSLKSGAMYDLDAVLPYVMKHKKDPVTGEAMKTSDLKPLKLKKCSSKNWTDDDDDFAHKYECPILGSEFTNATKICVVKKTGMYFGFFYYSFFLSFFLSAIAALVRFWMRMRMMMRCETFIEPALTMSNYYYLLLSKRVRVQLQSDRRARD